MNQVSGGRRFTDRGLLLVFISSLAVFFCWGRLSFFTEGQSLAYIMQSRTGLGIGEVIAFVALLRLAWELPNSAFLRPSQLLALSIASLALLIPSFEAVLVPVAVATPIFLFGSNPISRSMGQVFLALLFFEVIGRLIFITFAPFVLNVEAWAAAEGMSLFWEVSRNGPNITVVGGQDLSVAMGCSAFHNLSLATLLWVSLRKIQSTGPFLIADWLILTAMGSVTVIVNTARLVFMAHSVADFDYWHTGNGSNHIALIVLAALLGTYLIGSMIAEPK